MGKAGKGVNKLCQNSQYKCLNMRYITVIILLSISRLVSGIVVTEGVYEGVHHYVVKTKSATYWYDSQGGGFSRMIDREGNDWIAFRREPWNKYPESASSSYRGVPNLVFQGDDNGCGHPGWDKCITVFEPPNVLRSTSKSGKWEWTWTFYEDKAVMKVLKTDAERKYWFLYEGPAGGTFDPGKSFWMNSSNGNMILRDKPDHIKNQRITGNWKWVVFGRDRLKSRLFIIHNSFDNETDSFSCMGSSADGICSDEGMIVFGFGRTADSKPLLYGNHVFSVGFIYHIRKINKLL